MKIWKDKWKNPDFELTGREISILCSFMEIPVVYGIETDIFSDWSENPKEKVIFTCEKMEKKKLFFSDIGGKIIIPKELYEALKCMGFPKWMFWLRQTNDKGRRREYFIYSNNRNSIVLMPLGTGKYGIHLIKNLQDLEKIFGISYPSEKEENGFEGNDICIPVYILRKAKSMYEAFDRQGAEKLLREEMTEQDNEVLSFLLECIQNKVNFQVYDFWKWKNNHLVMQDEKCYGYWEENIFQIAIKETNLVLRKTPYEKVIRDIKEKIQEGAI